jgi:hypothetical protein
MRKVKGAGHPGHPAWAGWFGDGRSVPAAFLLAAMPVAALAEPPVDAADAGAVVSRLIVEPLIPMGEGADRWIVPQGRTGTGERFLCSVVFEVLDVLVTEGGVAIAEPVPGGLDYLPGSATGPGARIELSTDAGVTYRPEEQVAAGDGRVTHVRWILAGPLAAGMRGRVSFRARLAEGPSTSIADR